MATYRKRIDDSVDEVCTHCSTGSHSLTHIMTHCPALTHIRTQHNMSSPLDLWHSPANCLLFFRGAGLLGQTRWGTATTTTTTTLAHQLLQMKRWGKEEPQKTQSHSSSFRSRPVILGGITNRMQGLKFNYSAAYGNLQYTSNYLQYKSNYTRRHEHVKYCGPASSTSSSATGPAHLENTKRKINNYYCGVALLPTRLEQAQLINVWKASAHLERTKRED